MPTRRIVLSARTFKHGAHAAMMPMKISDHLLALLMIR
jgi:hypothetical protein